MKSFAQSFMTKCAELGVDPSRAYQNLDSGWCTPLEKEELRQEIEKRSMVKKANRFLQFAKTFARPSAATAAQATGRAVQPAVTGLGHAGQALGMAGGGFVGNMTADQMTQGAHPLVGGSINWGGQKDPTTGKTVGGWNINPLGIAAGAAMGHRNFRNSAMGQTLRKPLTRAMYGSGAGAIADTGAGMLGVDTGGLGGQLGGWGGMATGMGSNRYLNQKDRIVELGRKHMAATANNPMRRQLAMDVQRRQMQNLNSSATGRLNQAGNLIDQTWHGAWDPISGAARRTKQFFVGKPRSLANMAGPEQTQEMLRRLGGASTNMRGRLSGGQVGAAMPQSGASLAARRIGQLGTVVPLGVGAAGLAYNAGTNAMKKEMINAYDPLREQVTSDMDDYLSQRGLINEEGQFDPTQAAVRGLGRQFGQAGNQLGQALNPFMQMMAMGGQYADAQQGAQGQGGPGQHRSGMYQLGSMNTPSGRNELEAQRQRWQRGEQPSGQGSNYL